MESPTRSSNASFEPLGGGAKLPLSSKLAFKRGGEFLRRGLVDIGEFIIVMFVSRFSAIEMLMTVVVGDADNMHWNYLVLLCESAAACDSQMYLPPPVSIDAEACRMPAFVLPCGDEQLCDLGENLLAPWPIKMSKYGFIFGRVGTLLQHAQNGPSSINARLE